MYKLTCFLTIFCLSGCGTLRDDTNTHLIVSCADGGGFGSWIGLGGKTAKMTHSANDHTFTPKEMELFARSCPDEVTQDSIINR